MTTELDEFFRQIEIEKPLVEAGLATLQAMIMEQKDPAEITEYLEKGEGEKTLHNISDVRRIWCLLRVEVLEKKPLMHATAEEYVEDYELTLFSLRRLLFQLSEESFLEGMNYLKNSAPSPYKIYFILKNEQMQDNPIWKVMLPEVMKNTWTKEQVDTFMLLH